MRNGEVLSLFEAYCLIKRFSNVSDDGWVMIVCRLVRGFESKLGDDSGDKKNGSYILSSHQQFVVLLYRKIEMIYEFIAVSVISYRN